MQFWTEAIPPDVDEQLRPHLFVVNETVALPAWALAVAEAIDERRKLKER